MKFRSWPYSGYLMLQIQLKVATQWYVLNFVANGRFITAISTIRSNSGAVVLCCLKINDKSEILYTYKSSGGNPYRILFRLALILDILYDWKQSPSLIIGLTHLTSNICGLSFSCFYSRFRSHVNNYIMYIISYLVLCIKILRSKMY